MSDPAYPKAAYRLGDEMDIWGRQMDMRVLADEDDEVEALCSGWHLHPLDVPEDGEDDTITFTETPVRNKGGRPRKIPLEV